jgi:hypothetical protein
MKLQIINPNSLMGTQTKLYNGRPKMQTIGNKTYMKVQIAKLKLALDLTLQIRE